MTYHFKDSFKAVYLRIRKLLLLPLLFLRDIKAIKENEIKKILFLRHDRVGDMVLSTPVFKSLRKRFPYARLTVLASERNHEVIKNNPSVDEILIYNGMWWFLKEIRKRNFDLAMDLFPTYELKQAFLTYLSGAEYRIGFEKAGRKAFFNLKGPKVSKDKKMVELLLDLAEALGGEKEGCEPEIFLTEEEINRASESLINRGIGINELKIAIHPGAYYPSQRWRAERFGEVGRRIIEEYRSRVLLFGSQEEEGILKRVKEVAGNNGIYIFSGLKMREFMALLSMCNLMVCNNSGPLHIASALKVPTVSIMGPSVSPLWLPYGENHIVINKGLPCSPCNRAVCNDHECMELITVDEVMEAVQKKLLQLNR